MNPDTSPSSTSVLSLLQSLRDDTTTLLRQEVALAKAEFERNVSRIGAHSAEVAIGGFVAYAGLIVLLIGLGHLIGTGLARAGMDEEIAEWLAPALVGILIGGIGYLMMARAKRALTNDPIAPRDVLTSLKKDKNLVQSKIEAAQ
jgi:hypothetical protein